MGNGKFKCYARDMTPRTSKNWFYIWVLDSKDESQKERLAGRSNDKDIALETAKRQANIEDSTGQKRSLLVLDETGKKVGIFHPKTS